MSTTSPTTGPGTGVAPPGTVAAALRLTAYWSTVFRRTWRGGVVSALLTPLLYVVAMGVLLGGFVRADAAELEGATSYLAFVAPGLLAAHAMQMVIGETTYPVMSGVKWNKTYYAMHAAPIGIGAIVLAHLVFVGLRTLLACAAFVAVLTPFGLFATWYAPLLTVAVQVLVIGAFAAPVYAFSAGLDNEWAFNLLFRLGMIPMFLFSGAFFPVANLAAPLELLAKLTPLWHGVDLTRMVALGTVDAGAVVVHVAYLALLTAVGGWLAVRRLGARMVH